MSKDSVGISKRGQTYSNKYTVYPTPPMLTLAQIPRISMQLLPSYCPRLYFIFTHSNYSFGFRSENIE